MGTDDEEGGVAAEVRDRLRPRRYLSRSASSVTVNSPHRARTPTGGARLRTSSSLVLPVEDAGREQSGESEETEPTPKPGPHFPPH